MKAIYKVLPLFAAGALLASCNEMDTAPNGGYVTDEQKAEVIKQDPSMLNAGVSTLPTMLKLMHTVFGGTPFDDFGYASTAIMSDSRTADMMAFNIGANWYSGDLMYTDNTDTSKPGSLFWNYNYKLIYTVNNVIKTLPEELEDAQGRFYAGNAYAYRAYAYMSLAQAFQHTYKGNEDKPCVPLITDENSDEVAVDGGGPRASVQAIYDQIMDDLNKACAYLDGIGYDAATTGNDKPYIYANVAYGLRARANLIMNNWGDAASDADKAIQLSAAKGITPYTINELAPRVGYSSHGYPTVMPSGFWNIEDHSWMWAIQYTKDDNQYNWTNDCFTSHVSTFTDSGGYTAWGGAIRYAGVKFYNDIPTTDIRKMWWIPYDTNDILWWDTRTNEYVTLPDDYTKWIRDFIDVFSNKKSYYANVKFNCRDGLKYNGDGSRAAAVTGDFPMMRIEEMYLIKAEGQAMAGNPGQGAQTLVNFVQTYRNPQYSLSATSAEGVQEACYNQRRIELWGEGLIYWDVLRLKKGVDRRGQGFQPASCFVIEPGSDIQIFLIPRGEVDNNPLITANNPQQTNPSGELDTATYPWTW